ncbi:MAG TPA: thioredoxin domain-containing protein, partial [Streptosporangiaceae bacterium]
MNRLSDATSPYLLQHAGNPVDWWPWSDEAFAEARARDVPVLLSVGYAACHWCHVMAHESFEDAETAALLNENLVAIKVDREERPDVDAVYMAATQAMTGQGGWPMTVFMTPDGEPFYCGTYFPRETFQRLVLGVAKAWRDDRDGVSGQAGRIAATLAERGAPLHGQVPVADLAALCDQAVTTLAADYDEQHGGFGGAPKFPPSMVLEFLLRHSERPAAGQGSGGAGQGSEGAGADGGQAGGGPAGGTALAMVAGTGHAMARGGMYDQLGGGFARYSVDAGWVVPHFEKMLYDNALLARVYAHLWRRTGDPLARRVAQETCAWMIRELRTPEGGFASALDADSEGQEGLFYTWTPAELAAELGEADGRYAAEIFGVTQAGTFEHGRSVLQLRADPAEPDRFAAVRDALLVARERRVRPGRDDKVVAAWNGLAIAALAECGLLLADPGLTAAATGAADLLTRLHLRGDRLARTSRAGAAGPSAGVLEDFACVAEGLLVLSGVTGQVGWVGVAGQLLDTALSRFSDGGGAFYDTADDGEALIYRPADPIDGPTPSGTFATAGALLSYGALTGSARHREAALAALGALGPIAARYPRAAGAGLAVAEALVAGPAEIAVVGPAGDPRTAALHSTAVLAAPPGAVIALGDGTSVGAGDVAGATRAEAAEVVPLLAGRGLVAGAPA